MEQIHKQGLGSSLSILQRLDRVEGLVQFLEKKKSMSGTVEMALHEGRWKTLSSALEEVHYKGTLLERLEMIEKRVLQVNN